MSAVVNVVRPTLTLAAIVARTAAAFDIAADLIPSERKTVAISRPRQVVMWLALDLAGMSSVRVGRHLGGRDHQTVLAAVKRVRRLREEDAAFRATTDRLWAAIAAETVMPRTAEERAHDAGVRLVRAFERVVIAAANRDPIAALARFEALAVGLGVSLGGAS